MTICGSCRRCSRRRHGRFRSRRPEELLSLLLAVEDAAPRAWRHGRRASSKSFAHPLRRLRRAFKLVARASQHALSPTRVDKGHSPREAGRRRRSGAVLGPGQGAVASSRLKHRSARFARFPSHQRQGRCRRSPSERQLPRKGARRNVTSGSCRRRSDRARPTRRVRPETRHHLPLGPWARSRRPRRDPRRRRSSGTQGDGEGPGAGRRA